MTLLAPDKTLLDEPVTVVPEQTTTSAGVSRNVEEASLVDVQDGSATRTVLAVMAGATVGVWLLAAALITVIGDASPVAALGFGAYCAFWLGGGFGLIFGSAAAFGAEH